jgi:hypothetical protein
MRCLSIVSVIAALTMVGTACRTARHSSSAFYLPTDGDPERGKLAFVTLGCESCHEVAGVDLPRPTVQPPVHVVLGGSVESKLSDAYLVTSIINPSWDLAPISKEQTSSDGRHSRMPQYSDRMTVRQLADIVAFLQSRYVVVQMPSSYR